jgi:hypothetical protein
MSGVVLAGEEEGVGHRFHLVEPGFAAEEGQDLPAHAFREDGPLVELGDPCVTQPGRAFAVEAVDGQPQSLEKFALIPSHGAASYRSNSSRSACRSRGPRMYLLMS